MKRTTKIIFSLTFFKVLIFTLMIVVLFMDLLTSLSNFVPYTISINTQDYKIQVLQSSMILIGIFLIASILNLIEIVEGEKQHDVETTS
jgi:hypothetical protein